MQGKHNERCLQNIKNSTSKLQDDCSLQETGRISIAACAYNKDNNKEREEDQ